MKTLKLVSIGIVLFLLTATTAQAQVSLNVNIGRPPSWGLAGYSGIRYYYLPDVEAYYDIQLSRFIYNEGGVWVHRTYLPGRYRNYDLKHGYKVVLKDYRGDAPYIRHDDFRRTYARGYHGTEREYYFNKPGRGNDRNRAYNNDHRSDQKFDKRNDRDNGRSSDRRNDHDHNR